MGADEGSIHGMCGDHGIEMSRSIYVLAHKSVVTTDQSVAMECVIDPEWDNWSWRSSDDSDLDQWKKKGIRLADLSRVRTRVSGLPADISWEAVLSTSLWQR